MKKSRIFWLIPVLALSIAWAEEEAETPKRGWLGVFNQSLSRPMLIALNIEHGALVNEVAKGSPAEQAGLEMGDVIIELDEERIDDAAGLRYAVRKRPDKKVGILVRRRGKNKRLEVSLGIREKSGWLHEFELETVPEKALQAIRKAVRAVGPEVERNIELYVMPMDSLRKELDKLRKELEELKEELREKTKGM